MAPWTCGRCGADVSADDDGWHFCPDPEVNAPVRWSNLDGAWTNDEEAEHG